MALEKENTPDCISRRWMSRAVMSLKTVYPGDVILGLFRPEELAAAADDDSELELVIQLFGEPLGVHDGIVRPDDRVNVLEEHDPLMDRVRPVDGLELFVVVGEVARRVEELLRHDRRPQPDAGQREALAGLSDLTAALEVFAGRGAIEPNDLVILQTAHPPSIKRNQFHDTHLLSFYESHFH